MFPRWFRDRCPSGQGPKENSGERLSEEPVDTDAGGGQDASGDSCGGSDRADEKDTRRNVGPADGPSERERVELPRDCDEDRGAGAGALTEDGGEASAGRALAEATEEAVDSLEASVSAGTGDGQDCQVSVEGDETRGSIDRGSVREAVARIDGGQTDMGPATESDQVSQASGPLEVAGCEETHRADLGPEMPFSLDSLPRLTATRPRGKGRRLVGPEEEPARGSFTAEQRVLVLDAWLRSGLPARDFAALVGISRHTLYAWKKRFREHGPAGLMDLSRGAPRGSRLPEVTRRAILMMKTEHPEWGCQRISDMLVRGPALGASPSAVARVLHEAGYRKVEEPTRPHPDKPRRFEWAKPNQLWQTDLFAFVLKRQNRRVHLVAFLDDHSRFVVSFGLSASASTAMVLETLREGICHYGAPQEILTDNGPQYVRWRGKSQFTRELEKQGIRQIVSRPRRPQTLGKIERFWGTLWRELLELAVFEDLNDARTRIGHFMDYYNLLRPHRGIDGLVPADRFFGAASEVLRTLKERVAANALELAQHGSRPSPFYVTGQVDGRSFSLHGEGRRLILRRPGEPREEIELVRPADTESSDQCAGPSKQVAEQRGEKPDVPSGDLEGDGKRAEAGTEASEANESDENPQQEGRP